MSWGGEDAAVEAEAVAVFAGGKALGEDAARSAGLMPTPLSDDLDADVAAVVTADLRVMSFSWR